MDQVELHLTVLEKALTKAWKECQDTTSPLGELAALAAATLVFYQERERRREHSSPPERYPRGGYVDHTDEAWDHWSRHWKPKEL